MSEFGMKIIIFDYAVGDSNVAILKYNYFDIMIVAHNSPIVNQYVNIVLFELSLNIYLYICFRVHSLKNDKQIK